MKHWLFVGLLFFACQFAFGQEKVTWTVNYVPENNEIEFTAAIAGGWHLYSQHIKNDIGPVPTAFVFSEHNGIELVGPVFEPKPIQEYDENFEATLDFLKIKSFSNNVLKPTVKEPSKVTSLLWCVTT